MEYHNEIEAMDYLFDRLFPICRSITGPGLRETLDILGEYLPLEQFGVKTGTRVFDWEIPKEWHIRNAWLKGPNGEIIADFKKNNLHVVNYSAPVNRKIELEELKNHLFTDPNLPDAIPYVTSYYKERWGFCLSHNEYLKLSPGEYHVFIDSEFINGELNYSQTILPGQTDREILISSYVCHPSMANNELSGPIVAAFLYNRLAKWKKRRFTYRFVFAPETIGSITYLNRFGEHLIDKLHSGLVFTCLGGQTGLNYKLSRRQNSSIDNMVNHLFKTGVLKGTLRPFTPIGGSDERQYCSPGFNLPVGQIARMVYGSYPGYHNSLDDKDTMTIKSLYQSVNEIELILRGLELDGIYINQSPYGEVKLDRHGLYPDINAPGARKHSTNQVMDQRKQLNCILTLLNFADGEHTLLEIAKKCNCSVFDLKDIIDLLINKGLIKGPFIEKGVGF